MSFKEDLKTKIRLDRLFQRLISTIRETPGQRRVDKERMREFLRLTEMEYIRVRGLDLYVRPLDGEIKEVLVLDNELPIYHTTVGDVAFRKNPYWKEMLRIKNIKKILYDQDVILSKGRESLQRIYASALAHLDLSYTRKDMADLVTEARRNLKLESPDRTWESLALFFELLGFQVVSLGLLEENVQFFARLRANGGAVPSYEHLILFDDVKLQVLLKKGHVTPRSDLYLAHVIQCARGEKPADLEGAAVFEFLADLALEKPPLREHV